MVSFDEEGMMCLWGTRLEDEVDVAMAGLPPALELAGRARMRLGDVPVLSRGWGVKRKHTHVALDVQAEGTQAWSEMQAKYQFTHAVGDGCQSRHDEGRGRQGHTYEINKGERSWARRWPL